jgi:hypothetical protein
MLALERESAAATGLHVLLRCRHEAANTGTRRRWTGSSTRDGEHDVRSQPCCFQMLLVESHDACTRLGLLMSRYHPASRYL